MKRVEKENGFQVEAHLKDRTPRNQMKLKVNWYRNGNGGRVGSRRWEVGFGDFGWGVGQVYIPSEGSCRGGVWALRCSFLSFCVNQIVSFMIII